MQEFIQIQDLCKQFGAREILSEASVSIARNQKIGVVGQNGAGKSTLFQILVGDQEADSGEVVLHSDLKLGYLEQQEPYGPEETVLEFLMRHSAKAEWECGKVAGRFQLKFDLLHTRVRELSGGYRMRVKLSAMLLAEPNFLLLDEPSNYLDLETLILLENFLLSFNGGYLVISHDREFLKKTCAATLEVDRGSLFLYPGKLEEYLGFKRERHEQQLHYNRGVELKQKQLQQFVDRFKAKASKATQAQSKLKQLNRLKKIEIGSPLSNVRIKIPPPSKRGSLSLVCRDLEIGYPDQPVAQKIDLEVEWGSNVGVLGSNGEGKTTFLRTIAGQLDLRAGEFRWAQGLKIAYYAQHVYETLDESQSVWKYLESKIDPEVTRQEALNLAGNFLFRGDDIKKPISVLSGGERARLCLAGLLLMRCHVLLLDEPTNHLDFDTVESLGAALTRFPGTIFFVSHDRTFTNLVASAIVEVKGGRVAFYNGSYEDYVYHLTNVLLDDPETEEAKPGKDAKDTSGKKSKSRFQARKDLRAKLKRCDVELKALEREMAAHEKEKQGILDELAQPDMVYNRERDVRLNELTGLMSEQEERWSGMQAEIDRLKKELAELQA